MVEHVTHVEIEVGVVPMRPVEPGKAGHDNEQDDNQRDFASRDDGRVRASQPWRKKVINQQGNAPEDKQQRPIPFEYRPDADFREELMQQEKDADQD